MTAPVSLVLGRKGEAFEPSGLQRRPAPSAGGLSCRRRCLGRPLVLASGQEAQDGFSKHHQKAEHQVGVYFRGPSHPHHPRRAVILQSRIEPF